MTTSIDGTTHRFVRRASRLARYGPRAAGLTGSLERRDRFRDCLLDGPSRVHAQQWTAAGVDQHPSQGDAASLDLSLAAQHLDESDDVMPRGEHLGVI